jgi:hypothetical protein
MGLEPKVALLNGVPGTADPGIAGVHHLEFIAAKELLHDDILV